VDQTEDGVGAAQILRLGVTDWWRRVHGERGLLSQCPVRPMLVVVDQVLGQDPFEVPAAEDQHPVGALTSDGADEALGIGVARGALIGMRTIRMPSALKTSSKLEVNGTVALSRTTRRKASDEPRIPY